MGRDMETSEVFQYLSMPVLFDEDSDWFWHDVELTRGWRIAVDFCQSICEGADL